MEIPVKLKIIKRGEYKQRRNEDIWAIAIIDDHSRFVIAFKVIDIVLGDFKRIKLVGEVKWMSDVDKSEIRKAEGKLAKFNARRVIIVPDKSSVSVEPNDTELWDVENILKIL